MSGEKANCRIFMPGKPNSSMTAVTSAVMTPRSSASRDRPGMLPTSSTKSRRPGPGIHSPFSAVVSQAGTCQKPQNPRKWSSRTMSNLRLS